MLDRTGMRFSLAKLLASIGKPIYYLVYTFVWVVVQFFLLSAKLDRYFLRVNKQLQDKLVFSAAWAQLTRKKLITFFNQQRRLTKRWLKIGAAKIRTRWKKTTIVLIKKRHRSFSNFKKNWRLFHRQLKHYHRRYRRSVKRLRKNIHKRLNAWRPFTKKRPHLSLPSFSWLIVRGLGLATLLLVIFAGFQFYQIILKGLPHPKNLTERQQPITTKVFDRNGNLLYKIYQEENRTPIDLTEIPEHVVQATLAIEDRNFYTHAGLSLSGIARALRIQVQTDQNPGGSTITQQLIKNALLSSEKTYIRKAKEAILALLIETYYTKDEILSMYFNEVGYGGPVYGIEEAAQYYFGKSVRNINLAEASLLAGLPASPTNYSPFGARPELALSRQQHVLRRMVEDGYISRDQANQARKEKLAFSRPNIDIKAPHFVMFVRDWLVKQYGDAQVAEGGLLVTTSLDLRIQELAETVVQEQLASLRNLGVSNAAVLVTRPGTGEILAMVGSQDYFNVAQDGQVNVVTRPRQPGSSIKPITYVMALENGYTPISIIEDKPITYHVPGSPPYSPVNYDGKFHGKVTLRSALANSYNIPAVKTLDQFGVARMVNKARDMGITTWDNPSRFGLSLTLGGGEITMYDMAVAYGSLANMGYKVELNPILSSTDHLNQVLDQNRCALPSTNQIQEGCLSNRVVHPGVAYQIADILADNQARTPAFGRYSVLEIPNHQVAVKTGTTNSLRDNWTFGYTQDYVVSVWVGNNDNTPMSRIASGITGASSIWHDIMIALLNQTTPHRFQAPENLVRLAVCPLTNSLSCTACPNPKEEFFIPGTQPQKACNTALIQSVMTKPEPEQQLQANQAAHTL